MTIHPLAGQAAPHAFLVSIPRLMSAYYTEKPDPGVAAQRVSFGTSGHRGSSLDVRFNEDHVLAICQAVVFHRQSAGVDGPLFLGKDTHALSEAAFSTALEVFAANGVEVVVQADLGFTPTPVISHAILGWNRGRRQGLADGIILTPSHNPPEDGGLKYNPPSGGPADRDITDWIEDRANALLEAKLAGVRRTPYSRALAADTTHRRDTVSPYVDDLASAIDMEAIAGSGLRIGVDPLGGSGIAYWAPIAERYGLSLEVVNERVDPTFSFMTLDRDGKIRMDCSSPWAMAGLIGLRDRFDIAFGNDPDFDRHGIVTPEGGLLNPNHYLAVAIDYLYTHRPAWSEALAVGKTLVSSSMIDRVAASLGRSVQEVPVGFKWFVDGLLHGTIGFGGEESAGASFLRRDGGVWTTDKDGILLDLLAAEITAITGEDPGARYAALEARFGSPVYDRIQQPATAAQKALLKKMSPQMVAGDTLAGEPILEKLTLASGNAIGGLKVVTESGWFAARPSGTEDIYKLYAESFLGPDHLKDIQIEASALIDRCLEEA